MYIEICSDDRSVIMSLIEQYMDAEDSVNVTMNKRDDLYRVTLVQAVEPPTL